MWKRKILYIPDGLELLLVTLLLRKGGERSLRPRNGCGGCGPLLLQRVKLVNSLRLLGGNAVVVTNPVMLLLSLNLGQSVLSGPVPVCNAAIPVGRHLRLFSLQKIKKIRNKIKIRHSKAWDRHARRVEDERWEIKEHWIRRCEKRERRLDQRFGGCRLHVNEKARTEGQWNATTLRCES